MCNVQKFLADYTPVCTTELGAVGKLKAEFDKRGVKVLALSCNDVDSHKGCVLGQQPMRHS
jgi:1-Cys peroxiredoxin 6